MADFDKHRLEVLDLATDFAAALNEGDSISAVSGIVVARKSGGKWLDKSSEFGDPSGVKSGTAVDFTLGAAGADEQEAGSYRVRVTVTTTDGETLVATPSLSVDKTADPDAP